MFGHKISCGSLNISKWKPFLIKEKFSNKIQGTGIQEKHYHIMYHLI